MKTLQRYRTVFPFLFSFNRSAKIIIGRKQSLAVLYPRMGSRVKVFIRLRPVMKKENEDGMPQCCAKKATEKRLQLWNYRNPNSDVIEYE